MKDDFYLNAFGVDKFTAAFVTRSKAGTGNPLHNE